MNNQRELLESYISIECVCACVNIWTANNVSASYQILHDFNKRGQFLVKDLIQKCRLIAMIIKCLTFKLI